MARKVMVIDVKLCIACQACTMACKAENATPPGVWYTRVLEREEGKFPNPRKIIMPVLCNHCQDPPCERVCPTGATHQRDDGVVLVDYDECTGCKACMTACPYDARFFIKELSSYYKGELVPYEKVGYSKHQVGVVEKCNFCVDRTDKGLEPACVLTCITSCRHFGDLDDPRSEVARLLRSRSYFQLSPHLGTKPSVYYLL